MLGELVEQFEESEYGVGESGDPVEVVVGVEVAADEAGGISEVDGGAHGDLSVAGEGGEADLGGGCEGDALDLSATWLRVVE